MNMKSKLLFSCLMLVSFGVAAQSNGTASRGTGEGYYYRTGQPAPIEMLADSNVIKNYHHYHLYKPLDGYEWVRGNASEYLMVSTKTRIVNKIEYRPNIPAE